MTNLLEETLAAATKDGPARLRNDAPDVILPEGAELRYAAVRMDDRGSLMEVLRNSDEPDTPIEQVYTVSVRPGLVKGWALHKLHDDRYFILSGDLLVVLYDVRPESKTCGQIFKLVLSGNRPAMLRIPANVWHADHNVGTSDVLMLNLPTMEYDLEDPDKFRLPIDTDLIPYSFGAASGW
ncbi:dTDP-4-dehydrorhamnose 3,5-epimerase family protein [Roseovarius sp. 2305UL8-3]|uniref:polysaccharide biosynthesis C-terminal domain-containing protein n=1 Tax=Roseovarius conchicola TaxID=3121636 RepID=UPI0035290B28